MIFCLHADFFFCKIYLFKMPSVSNSFDRDQAPHLVGHDLGPNCSQRLLADDTCR